MKISFLLCVAVSAAFFASCNPERGKPREEQLENTAVKLEAKAVEVLDNVEQSASVKEEQAAVIREENGDQKVAEVLEKDAETTREVGKIRASQLEEQAEKVRDKREDLLEARP